MAGAIGKPSRILLQEYGAPVLCKADEIDLRSLMEANQRWAKALGLSGPPIRIEIVDKDHLRLRAEAVTGVIRVGHTDIEIAPKFLSTAMGSWQTVLWRILLVVEGGHVDDVMTTGHELTSLSLPDLLAEMFLASYARGAARGLPRGYLSLELSGPTLRGRLDLARIGNWVARPWDLPYVADFLTDDTPLARLLRWTAECLAVTVKSPGRARATREIAASLTHVSRQPPHLLDAQRIILGTQHQGLDAAKIVGLLLLEGSGVHHARGAYELSGFLWDSDVIYENYIYWLCGRAASKSGRRITKSPVKFGKLVSGIGSLLETTPDVVFRDEQGRPVAIIDSKYKRMGSRPKAQDTYQVLTAGHVLGCRKVSLAYPVADPREPTVWRVDSALGSGDIELTALPLNLMSLASPEGQLTLIDRIGEWLG